MFVLCFPRLSSVHLFSLLLYFPYTSITFFSFPYTFVPFGFLSLMLFFSLTFSLSLLGFCFNYSVAPFVSFSYTFVYFDLHPIYLHSFSHTGSFCLFFNILVPFLSYFIYTPSPLSFLSLILCFFISFCSHSLFYLPISLKVPLCSFNRLRP